MDLIAGGFNFGTQTQHPSDPGYWDIAYCIYVDPPLGHQLCAWWGAGILAVPDTTVENITYAPEDPASYDPRTVPVDERAYVVRTGDGYYAKFAVRQFQPYVSLLIEYYVQMDGTNNLRDDLVVAVEPTTWGRVKALYR